MNAEERLRDWCGKNRIHDYRKGTQGHRLLIDAVVERYQREAEKYNKTKEKKDATSPSNSTASAFGH